MIINQLKSTDIVPKLQIPDEDASTPIQDSEAQFIFDFIQFHGIKKTLETGLAYAKSASHIIASTNETHIAIDPFQNDYHRLGVKNIKGLGLEKLLDLREDYSHNVLPELVKEGRKFEFIFIDGDHKFDCELVDFYYADLLLVNKGYILLHDTWLNSTKLLMSFINTNRKDYKQLTTGIKNFALYQKFGKDTRNTMFFREFCGKDSNSLKNKISWILNRKLQRFKNFLLLLKDKLKVYKTF
mgnify:CR=1 FL=1